MSFYSSPKETKSFHLYSLSARSTGMMFIKKEEYPRFDSNVMPVFSTKTNFKVDPINTNKQLACSAFMKNYIDRLKRERKRQEKKQYIKVSPSQIKTNFNRTKSLLQANGKRQLFKEIQQIKKHATKKNRTVSKVIIGVDDDIQRKLVEAEEKRQIQMEEKDRMMEVIRDIKQCKQKKKSKIGMNGIDSNWKINQKYQKKEKKAGLPQIKGNKKQSKNSELIKSKSFEPFYIKDLEPWKGDNFNQGFSIQEYRSNQ